ncbi:YbaY family lipoprotein [Chitinivorax sp. B]|uniref:YbaY family lipoprotein n=1 Tax=Chitinivorax sp. B TaxID=2502235 RepID=UPI0010F57BE3|nr:YbaY family lipoprotein [Chitinivorax sp. B]
MLIRTMHVMLLGLALSGVCSVAQGAEALTKKVGKMMVLKGGVVYRERMALPPNAKVQVRLDDVSLMDVAATTIAQQTIQTKGKQVPIAFKLRYPANKLEAKRQYALTARIEVDGKLWFINTTSHPVDPTAPPAKSTIEVEKAQ